MPKITRLVHIPYNGENYIYKVFACSDARAIMDATHLLERDLGKVRGSLKKHAEKVVDNIGRNNMAWIIGLADDAEIARILRAGYEVHDHKLMPDIGYFATPDGVSNDKGIAVFVDCDVQELLNLTEEK